MTFENVQLTLSLDSGNEAIVSDPLFALADLLQEQLVDRLRAGCDYGNLRDANGNTVGSWNLYLDQEGDD